MLAWETVVPSFSLLYYIPFSGYAMINTPFTCQQTVSLLPLFCYCKSCGSDQIEHASDALLQEFLLGSGSQWQFCPQRTLANVRRHFWFVSTGDATGIQWIEAWDAIKYPTMHRTSLTTKKYLSPNVKSVEVEKLLQGRSRIAILQGLCIFDLNIAKLFSKVVVLIYTQTNGMCKNSHSPLLYRLKT